MTDSEVTIAIKGVLDTAIGASSFFAEVTQSYNPTMQGPTLNPLVVFTKISARRYGFQSQKAVYDSNRDEFDQTSSWYLRATYQVNVLMNQDVSDISSLNAYDVVDFCAGILQTRETRQAFLVTGTGIGIDRITDIRLTPVLDESDRYNLDPSFDFVLSYQNSLTSVVPSASVTVTTNRI